NIGNIRFIIGTIAFSLGESYLFPQMELLLNKLSPDNLKATYFGAIEIRQIGFFLGPVCGGMIYHEYGAICLFIFCSIFLFLISILYMKQFFKMLIKI
ncbi:MAG: hypothetical protein PHC75_09495, partial [Burkholderiales bacterium]|nr:hypothetical protein [Burkholderiales bacterium]